MACFHHHRPPPPIPNTVAPLNFLPPPPVRCARLIRDVHCIISPLLLPPLSSLTPPPPLPNIVVHSCSPLPPLAARQKRPCIQRQEGPPPPPHPPPSPESDVASQQKRVGPPVSWKPCVLLECGRRRGSSSSSPLQQPQRGACFPARSCVAGHLSASQRRQQQRRQQQRPEQPSSGGLVGCRRLHHLLRRRRLVCGCVSRSELPQREWGSGLLRRRRRRRRTQRLLVGCARWQRRRWRRRRRRVFCSPPSLPQRQRRVCSVCVGGGGGGGGAGGAGAAAAAFVPGAVGGGPRRGVGRPAAGGAPSGVERGGFVRGWWDAFGARHHRRARVEGGRRTHRRRQQQLRQPSVGGCGGAGAGSEGRAGAAGEAGAGSGSIREAAHHRPGRCLREGARGGAGAAWRWLGRRGGGGGGGRAFYCCVACSDPSGGRVAWVACGRCCGVRVVGAQRSRLVGGWGQGRRRRRWDDAPLGFRRLVHVCGFVGSVEDAVLHGFVHDNDHLPSVADPGSDSPVAAVAVAVAAAAAAAAAAKGRFRVPPCLGTGCSLQPAFTPRR